VVVAFADGGFGKALAALGVVLGGLVGTLLAVPLTAAAFGVAAEFHHPEHVGHTE